VVRRRPGNPMHLQLGRLSSPVADASARDSYIICHDTLTYGPTPPTPGAAGGPGKPTGSNPGRAPRSDPTNRTSRPVI
jgi:hypothetical protein